MAKMWTARSEPITHGLRFAVELGSRTATHAEIVHAWQSVSSFRDFFNSLLAEVPFAAFRWETPHVTAATATQPFECVVLDSYGLARPADANAYAEHFCRSDGPVATFPNLGGDAILVVPCPIAESSCYAHLADFVRLAPAAQRDALWQAVGEAMARRISAKPVWLSTAGAGVAWLHVRLDDEPKYYGYGPYRIGA